MPPKFDPNAIIEVRVTATNNSDMLAAILDVYNDFCEKQATVKTGVA